MDVFAFLDSVFAPLLSNPTFFVMGVSFVLTVIATVLSVVLIKKDVRERIKHSMKRLQGEMKAAQKEKNVKKMQELQKEQMDTQLLHMKSSLKPMVVGALLIIFVYAWMRHLYMPVVTLDANQTGEVMHNNASYAIMVTEKDSDTRILESDGQKYELHLKGMISKSYKNDNVELYGETWEAQLVGDKLSLSRVMTNVPFFGNLGLIGWYLLTAFTFGIVLRKLFDIV